jgi:hypothetical protein
MRPLQNPPFCPISASGSNFNPQNTKCIPVVKIFAFPSGAQALRAGGLNLNKNEDFSKVSEQLEKQKQIHCDIKNETCSYLFIKFSISSASIGMFSMRSTGPFLVTRMSFSSRMPIPSALM